MTETKRCPSCGGTMLPVPGITGRTWHCTGCGQGTPDTPAKPGFEDAARDARSIATDVAMLQAAIDAGQPAPALAGGILAAATRILEAFGQHPARRTVRVTVRDVYGKPTVYPDCDNARLFAELAGRKTLGRYDIQVIRDLGYTITMAQDAGRLPDGFGHAEIEDPS